MEHLTSKGCSQENLVAEFSIVSRINRGSRQGAGNLRPLCHLKCRNPTQRAAASSPASLAVLEIGLLLDRLQLLGPVLHDNDAGRPAPAETFGLPAAGIMMNRPSFPTS